ncbi:GAF domain-containing protein [Leptolyngbya sp. CCNP1308]|uniref:GAF domain-containing protein n=1 Tax=Leptolyngbya sp. CCNP1308 TaxID=3110255 RepID=UPI002B213931|nr:GAF domain-containing protein [Leptolyngbya sp. CCNP1308]MEA5449018.1 GAF domain-containing protein [Leptolyngbya sp. CCNP1308]
MANESSRCMDTDQSSGAGAMPMVDLGYALGSLGGSAQAPVASLGQEPEELPTRPLLPWLELIQHYSHLVMAVVDVATEISAPTQAHPVLFANQYFCRLTGIQPEGGHLDLSFFDRLAAADQKALRERFRRHFLSAVLGHAYGAADLVSQRLLHEPLVVSLDDSQTGQGRKIELRLRTAEGGLQVTAIAPSLQAALADCWATAPSREQVATQLLSKDPAFRHLLTALKPGQYTASGQILIEGIDVTERETSKALIELLVGHESVLGTRRFEQANGLMKQLFSADESFLLSAENNRAQLFSSLDQADWHTETYAVEDLQGSSFLRATERQQVVNVPDLSLDCATQCERDMLDQGMRSLLLIPLVMRTVLGDSKAQMVGLVGLASSKPYAFDQADRSRATTLIPALTTAMRHSVQDRFTNIHPSVRWRFEQEAERLSLGLPPAPIVFESVYPLYGISDIRGSSDERNRAIQQDLLTQFRLALAVVEAAGRAVSNALVGQLALDLADHIAVLKSGVTVDSEVTLLRYLQGEVEGHFAYFAQHSPEADAAIAQYKAAIDADHGCVYTARALYDETIGHINGLLRDTWNQWQQSMQAITPHYCDLEATDGIDHMIYAGQAIDQSFTEFQLKSLRYEQLRAVCDCARKGFSLKATYDTDMTITHLVLVQGYTVDICHDESTERLFDVRGTRDTRYEIVKKRIDKACDAEKGDRITQPGMLTVVYSTGEEWQEYERYLRYLHREGIVASDIEQGTVEPLQGVNGLKFARVRVNPE